MVFYMPTVVAVTPTASYFPASKMGQLLLIPNCLLISEVLVILSLTYIHDLGIFLLPTDLSIYFEMKRNEPDMLKIRKLMKRIVI